MHRTDKHGRSRVLRTVYECGVFQTLREQLRCKEIWVMGSDRWRNPDEDLPADFADKRAENYQKLNQPLDPDEFIAHLHGDMVTELAHLSDALPCLGWVEIAECKAGAISLSPLEARAEPRNLRRLKKALRAKWSVVPLLDMLKETALRTGMLEAFTGVGTREAITTEELGPGAPPARSPTRSLRFAPRRSGGRARPRWGRTPRTSRLSIRTCSPSGIRGTGAGRAHLLAHRGAVDGGALPVAVVLGLGGAHHGGGGDAPRHLDGGGGQLGPVLPKLRRGAK